LGVAVMVVGATVVGATADATVVAATAAGTVVCLLLPGYSARP